MSEEEINKLFRRIELDKTNDSCGFEFADGFGCTFDNIATCYDDRLKLYDLVKDLQQELTKYKERNEKAIELLTNEYESCKGALTNPEYTIVSKHQLLKNDLNTIKKLIEIIEDKEKK